MPADHRGGGGDRTDTGGAGGPHAAGGGSSADPHAGVVIHRVAVVGAGTMGGGIAQVCLTAGCEVRLTDASVPALERALERIRESLERLVAKGQLSTAGRDAALRSLTIVGPADGSAAAVDGAELVIEAAAEDLEVKERLFRELDEVTGAEVILATNTSSLPVAACASATRRPERVLGLHFFNPAPRMALVEVVATARTSRLTLERATAFVASLGKVAVHCADAPGFIVNRVGRPYLVEAVRMLEAGEASVEAIDASLEAVGYPMGPFRLIDLIGLDVDLAIDRALSEAFGEARRFAPPELEQRLAEAGRLGRKSGHGFYRYTADGAATADVAGAHGNELPAASIVERLELAVVNEAYRAVEEGVASPPAVDTAMRLGAGHPQGPFERVDAIGLRHIVVRLRELHAIAASRSGEQYEVAPSLWQMATV